MRNEAGVPVWGKPALAAASLAHSKAGRYVRMRGPYHIFG